jgi:hypothetical protein
LKAQRAWFATAGEAVSWFRMRRSVVFEKDSNDPEHLCAKITYVHDDQLPGLRLRVQKPNSDRGGSHSACVVDTPFNRSAVVRTACEAGGLP